MKLTIYQKSVYRIIINATMILRSIGKTYKKDPEKLKDFKYKLFKKIEILINLMDKEKLKNKKIRQEIKDLASECNVSVGQSQKCINVILKYHFLLNYNNPKVKKELDCPLDSLILKELGVKKIFLNKMNFEKYTDYQNAIESKLKQNQYKLDFDDFWDNQNLKKDGLL